MISWFIIILGIFGLVMLYKLVSVKHRKVRFSMVLVLFLFLFFIGSLYFVSIKNNVDMTTLDGFFNGMKVYGLWLFSGFSDMGSSVTGYFSAVDNSTNNSVVKTGDIVNNTIDSTKNLMRPRALKK